MAWSEEQIRNANVIASVGRSLGASRRDIMIALMAGIVESGLRNLRYGDRDSVGIFQQRSAWGSTAERTDPAKAARMFFTGGHAGQAGLFDIANRGSMSPGQAAQKVQVSAYPDRYAEHQAEAVQLLDGVKGVPTDYSIEMPDTTIGRVPGLSALSTKLPPKDISPSYTQVDGVGAITADDSQLGAVGDTALSGGGSDVADQALDALSFEGAKPITTEDPMADLHMPSAPGGGGGGGGGYSGGGGGYSLDDMGGLLDLTDFGGPDVTLGADAGWRNGVVTAARKMLGVPYVWGGTGYNGVDCSGLIKMIFDKQGMKMPRISNAQANSGRRISLNSLQPGDLVAWDNSSRNNGADHIAVYIGNGQIIEAPKPGSRVQISEIYDTDRAWGVSLGTQQQQTGSGQGAWGAQLNVAAAGRQLAQKYGISDVGGFADRNVRGGTTKSDHAYGLALDFMGAKQDLADEAVARAQELNVKYVIFDSKIWSAERAEEGWRDYDGESPHTDHVHVSFNSDSMGSAPARPEPRPTRSAPRRPAPRPAPASPRSVSPANSDDRPKPKPPPRRGPVGGKKAV